MSEKVFLLVRWLEDETVGVFPVTAVKKGQGYYVGACIDTKYKKKLYHSEVLKISGKSNDVLSVNCSLRVITKLQLLLCLHVQETARS